MALQGGAEQSQGITSFLVDCEHRCLVCVMQWSLWSSSVCVSANLVVGFKASPEVK